MRRSSSTAPPSTDVWRFEYKYLVRPEVRAAMTGVLRAFCSPDLHGEAGGLYTVRSLYLDTPGWSSFFEKMDGEADRDKLRIRTYPDRVGHVLTARFEVKRRRAERISKKVASLDIPDFLEIEPILTGVRWPDRRLQIRHPVLREFFRIKVLQHRTPALTVQYRRQAMRLRGDASVRITFDDRLEFSTSTKLLDPGYFYRSLLRPSMSILEIKAQQRLPVWLARLIDRYNLRPQSASKYALAAAAGPQMLGDLAS